MPLSNENEYSSDDNTQRLSKEELIQLLLELSYIKYELSN